MASLHAPPNPCQWLSEIHTHATEDTCTILVGNKCDLISKRVVDTEQAQQFAQQIGVPYIETSAKQFSNVEEMFMALARQIKDKFDAEGGHEASSDKKKVKRIVVGAGKPTGARGGGCSC